MVPEALKESRQGWLGVGQIWNLVQNDGQALPGRSVSEIGEGRVPIGEIGMGQKVGSRWLEASSARFRKASELSRRRLFGGPVEHRPLASEPFAQEASLPRSATAPQENE